MLDGLPSALLNMALASVGDGFKSPNRTTPSFDNESLPKQSLTASEKPSDPSEATVTSSAFSKFAQDLWHFLISADNETLGACIIGLCAVIYVVFGRLGLVFIGMVVGALLHASWDRSIGNVIDDRLQEGEYIRRREGGLDVVARVLGWRLAHGAAGGNDHDGDNGHLDVLSLSQKQQNLADLQPATWKALDRLVDAVTRDYIR